MSSFDSEFGNRLASRVQVWPCSLMKQAWLFQFDPEEWVCGGLSLSQGELVMAAHKELLVAGADALVTNTLGTTAVVMQDYNAAGEVEAVNRESARLALEVSKASRRGKLEPLVVGSIVLHVRY